jgi:transcriptional regulator of acetoin/glycerol metabolism
MMSSPMRTLPTGLYAMREGRIVFADLEVQKRLATLGEKDNPASDALGISRKTLYRYLRDVA